METPSEDALCSPTPAVPFVLCPRTGRRARDLQPCVSEAHVSPESQPIPFRASLFQMHGLAIRGLTWPRPERDGGVLNVMQKPVDHYQHAGMVPSSEHCPSSVLRLSPSYPAGHTVCVPSAEIFPGNPRSWFHLAPPPSCPVSSLCRHHRWGWSLVS